MSQEDPGNQECIEEFLGKSLLGDELINTQFHLFSARSWASGRVVKPRVLCANNVFLAKSSQYFLGLLSSDISPSDPSLSDLTDGNDVPSDIRIDEYGYASDSDLDDEKEVSSVPVVNTRTPKDRPSNGSTSLPRASFTSLPEDNDELQSESGSESERSDMFVMSPEHPRGDESFVSKVDGIVSVASSETIQETPMNNTLTKSSSSAAVRLRSLGSRHILVKDTAFQTWYTLLNYLYTGNFSFLPLSSAMSGGLPYVSSTSSFEEPKCSAKSMYQLACKVGLDHLRGEALAHIRNNLSEHNILKELSCKLISKHPELLDMELDVLYAHIASPPVVDGFPVFAQRIALHELPHGTDIIIGIHARMLRERQAQQPTPPVALVDPSEEEVECSESPLQFSPPSVSVEPLVLPDKDKVKGEIQQSVMQGIPKMGPFGRPNLSAGFFGARCEEDEWGRVKNSGGTRGPSGGKKRKGK